MLIYFNFIGIYGKIRVLNRGWLRFLIISVKVDGRLL